MTDAPAELVHYAVSDAVATITDLLVRYGQGGSGHDPAGPDRPYWSSFLVADPGDAWVVETSGTTWAAEQVHDLYLEVSA